MQLGATTPVWGGKALALAVTALLCVGHSAARGQAEAPGRECGLERPWQAGDAYSWEDLEFSDNGSGLSRRYDRHREQERISFRWATSGSTLIVTLGNDRREVHYTIETRPHDCVLRFDVSPIPGSHTELYGRRGRPR